MAMSTNDAAETIAEIENNTPQQIKKKRSHARLSVRAKVRAEPANASERKRFQSRGVLGDISRGGCLILFPDPLLVGDIYRLSFDRDQLDLEPTFARCLRCRLVRDDAFEAGFNFFSPVDISALEKNDGDGLLD